MTFLLIRPDSWNLPLFVHVAGAMAVTAALVVAAGALIVAWRAEGDDRVAATRFGFRTLLFAGVPAYLVMHGAAEWLVSRENIPDKNQPGWVGLGYGMADIGGIVMLLAIILTWLGLRRLRSGGGGGGLARAAAVLASVVIAMFIVAIWAMTTKPS